MKYNLDCIRAVLMALEKCLTITKTEDKDGVWHFEHNEIWLQKLCEALPHYDFADVVYSVEKLEEAKFITVVCEEGIEDYPEFHRITSITYEGHEFLENIREPKTLDILKERAAKAGSVALSFIGALSHAVCLDIALGKIIG